MPELGLQRRRRASTRLRSSSKRSKKAHLRPNFKKLLLVQLKKLVASEKLVKVKNSFKLSSAAKPVSAAVKKAPAAAAIVKALVKKTVVAKAKAKAVTPVKTKKVEEGKFQGMCRKF
ncbi:unnamed protein product [Camellia sinensis]